MEGQFQNSASSEAISYCQDINPDEDKEASDVTADGRVPVIKESGTYCLDGKKVGDKGMSDDELKDACGV